MKIAPLILEMNKYQDRIKQLLVHTGQHYDYNMNKLLFKQLQIPKPDIFLNVGSGLHAEQTGKVMISLEKVLLKHKPDLVLVVGDVNSTLAAVLTAKKLNIKVAHVEAGLRSYDPRMPEEINRKVTDVLSDYLFTTCKDANKNLRKEGIDNNKIFFVGNVMIDTLVRFLPMAQSKKSVFDSLLDKNYLVITLHRPSNVDKRKKITAIINTLIDLSKKIPIIFPLHPRTEKRLHEFGLIKKIRKYDKKQGITVNTVYYTNSLGYIEFFKLYLNSKGVITDSGGIQEETTYLNIPCFTLRENTERPITIKEGTNRLVNENNLFQEVVFRINNKIKKRRGLKYWDGRAGKRIVNILIEKIENILK